uniref:Opioid growth factor receptor-like protein 1 n=1 Tax=Sphaeramia orbicularis TaxID=375764 RepID=A0A673AFK0_9TELE
MSFCSLGVYIDDFHNDWYREYEALEYEFCQNTTAKENLLKSYKLMLDFYGIELCDEETGEVRRSSNWRDRFDNLNNHTHNNLRITRILKCLATLGYPQYQEPLVHFYLEETLVKGELANVKDSVLNYFIFAVRDKKQRRKLLKFAYLNYDRRDEFVWCPKKVQMKWSGVSESKQDEDMTDGWGAASTPRARGGPQTTEFKLKRSKSICCSVPSM